jgi:hypothetical protein
MPKTFEELFPEGLTEPQDVAPVSADVSATIAPGELTTAGILSVDQEERGDGERAWDTMKATSVEIGTPLATGIAASPLLAGGPLGWAAYAAIQLGSGMGSNAIAQKMRNPEEDWSPEEGVAAGVFSAIPGIQAAKVAKLGKLGTVGVRAGEGAAMAAGETVTRQALEIAADKREELDAFEIGFATVAGTGTGAVLGRAESSSVFNRLGVSSSDAKKIQAQVESNVADRINTIERLLKKPELEKGDQRNLLIKERDELKEQLETVSKTDRQYLENLKAKNKEEIAKTEQALVERLNQAQEAIEGNRNLKVDGGEAKTTQPKVVKPSKPVKLTAQEKAQAIERLGMSDEDLSELLLGKTNIIPVNLSAFTNEEGVQKTMAALLEQITNKVKKGTIKTDKKSLIQQAAKLRNQLDPSIDPVEYAKQVANESEEIIFKSAVADSMTFSAFSNWNKKMEQIADLSDPSVVNDLIADLDRLGEFAEASSKIASSAGKLLQSRKVFKEQIAASVSEMERRATKLEKGLTSDLVKYSKDLKPGEIKDQLDKLGGLKAMRGFVNELRLVKDPAKLGKLLEISRKGRIRRFAEAYMELRYDAMLSAPVTQGAAALGNAIMSSSALINQAVGGLATGNLQATRMAVNTTKNLLAAAPDAMRAAMIAAKNSQGQMSLSTHYEKVGGKALAMEATGMANPLGETIENVGELISFGPKGLVFQDELYRHMFAKAQVKSLLAEEYRQLVRKGEVSLGKLDEFIEGRMSRYFVDGKRYKTKADIELEAVSQARKNNLDGQEAVAFVKQYTDENWTNKLSSELEYLRDFGDRITFQQDLSKDYGLFESMGAGIQDLRERSFAVQYLVPFIKTPVNIFKEVGGTASLLSEIPGISKLWARSREEFLSDNPNIRAQARGRQIVGAGLWATALYLADQGIITSSGPRKWRELENKKATGWQPNAINVSAMQRMWKTGDSGGDKPGDKYVSLAKADPLATITGLSADIMRAAEDNDVPEQWLAEKITAVMLGLSQAVGQKSYLETVGSTLNALVSGRAFNEETDWVNGFLEELIRGNTPSILNALGRSDDPYIREVNGPLEALYNRLPALSSNLDPKRDPFGRKKPSAPGRISRELNALIPARYSETTTDKALQIINEVRGSYAFQASDKVIPGIDLQKIKVPGKAQSLYDRWKELYSELDPAGAIVEAFEDPEISEMAAVSSSSPLTDYRRQTINTVLSSKREEAKGLLLEEYPDLLEQFEYLGEMQLKQIEGEETPREIIAPSLQPLLQQ